MTVANLLTTDIFPCGKSHFIDDLLSDERKAIAEAFVEAKKDIEGKPITQHTFICVALNKINTDAADDAKRVVRGLMNGPQKKCNAVYLTDCSTLDNWVHGVIYNYDKDNFPTLEQMRAYRLRWLDILIAKFSA